jgi:hypothetical protein
MWRMLHIGARIAVNVKITQWSEYDQRMIFDEWVLQILDARLVRPNVMSQCTSRPQPQIVVMWVYRPSSTILGDAEPCIAWVGLRQIQLYKTIVGG